MHTLPETFKNCEPIPSEERCPECNAILYNKRLNIDITEFRNLQELGITHKAVNFCSNPSCSYIEQGIIYRRGSEEKFLCITEIDGLMKNIVDNYVDRT